MQIFFQLILWTLPTFFWPGENLPTPATTREGEAGAPFAEDRLGSLINNLGQSSPTAIYNRLLCPQCVAQNLAIFFLLVRSIFNIPRYVSYMYYLYTLYVFQNFLQLSGKVLFWWWLSSLPNFSSFTILPVWGVERREDTEVRIDFKQSPTQQQNFPGDVGGGGGILQTLGDSPGESDRSLAGHCWADSWADSSGSVGEGGGGGVRSRPRSAWT